MLVPRFETTSYRAINMAVAKALSGTKSVVVVACRTMSKAKG